MRYVPNLCCTYLFTNSARVLLYITYTIKVCRNISWKDGNGDHAYCSGGLKWLRGFTCVCFLRKTSRVTSSYCSHLQGFLERSRGFREKGSLKDVPGTYPNVSPLWFDMPSGPTLSVACSHGSGDQWDQNLWLVTIRLSSPLMTGI